MYLWGLDEGQFHKKLRNFEKHLKQLHQDQVMVVKTPFTLTFVTQFPSRHIQFVLGKWDSIEQVLMEAGKF